MKQIKKFLPVLLAVVVFSAVFVAPAFAQSGNTPPVVDAPVFDWAKISEAAYTLLSALLLPVAGFAARWFFVQGNYQKSLLSKEQQTAFDMALKVFVYAAEQMKLSGFIKDKLDHVIILAQAWLAQRKIMMPLDELVAHVEATVLREFNMPQNARN